MQAAGKESTDLSRKAADSTRAGKKSGDDDDGDDDDDDDDDVDIV